MATIISVIMPVFNQEGFLDETIQSVLNQTLDDFEFLILDDGSTDKSAEIIRKYATKDGRIQAFFFKNRGKCVATNELASMASGKYLSLLDADDVMMPTRLERQLDFLKSHPELDGCSSHCYYIDQKGCKLGQQCYPYLKTIEDCEEARKTSKSILCSYTALTISREAYLSSGGLVEKFWPGEDVEFINKLIDSGFNILIIQEKLMKYRVHPFSITNSNLWHSYVEMSGYIRHCRDARRDNVPEISFEEFMELRNNEPWYIKFDRRRFFYSKMYHRDAGFALYSKQYFNFSWKILIASILSPKYVWASLKNRI